MPNAPTPLRVLTHIQPCPATAAATGALAAGDGNYGDVTVSGGGTVFTINANAINQAKLATNSVTTVKIVDNAVTSAKLAPVVPAVTAGAYAFSNTTVNTKGQVTAVTAGKLLAAADLDALTGNNDPGVISRDVLSDYIDTKIADISGFGYVPTLPADTVGVDGNQRVVTTGDLAGGVFTKTANSWTPATTTFAGMAEPALRTADPNTAGLPDLFTWRLINQADVNDNGLWRWESGAIVQISNDTP